MVLGFAADLPPAQDRPPPNEPPKLWRAAAVEKDGKVVIQMEWPDYVAPRQAVAAEPMKWRAFKPVILGETVHAFAVDGKPVGAKAVVMALAQPKAVPVFERYFRPLLDPDPYYLRLFREGTVVLVVAAEDIADPVP
jgi:hypothetical protein